MNTGNLFSVPRRAENQDGLRREFEVDTLSVDMWHVLEYEQYQMEPLCFGQLHDHDTYVIRWRYRITQSGTCDLVSITPHISLCAGVSVVTLIYCSSVTLLHPSVASCSAQVFLLLCFSMIPLCTVFLVCRCIHLSLHPCCFHDCLRQSSCIHFHQLIQLYYSPDYAITPFRCLSSGLSSCLLQ